MFRMADINQSLGDNSLKHASELKTGLLLIDIQSGLTVESGFYGTGRSTPHLERNVALLLSSARQYNASLERPAGAANHSVEEDNGRSVFIIHVCHHSSDPRSPLYPGKETVAFMPCAQPVEGEPVICKITASAFIGTNVEQLLRDQGVRQLMVCGTSTEHCVSTSVRMAADLGIVRRGRQKREYPERGDGKEEADRDNRIVAEADGGLGILALIEDACAAFNKPGKFDAETVHKVHVASLENEFARVVTTREVCQVVLKVG